MSAIILKRDKSDFGLVTQAILIGLVSLKTLGIRPSMIPPIKVPATMRGLL